MFGRDGQKVSWKADYENGIYKIYDWNKRLAGYFFPDYGQIEPEGAEEEAIEQMNDSHANLGSGGHLMVPMLKLELLDNESAMSIDYVINSLESNRKRAEKWVNWIRAHSAELSILSAGVHTAREDRNMLSIAMGLTGPVTLENKHIIEFLTPLLNKLHDEGLL